MKTIVKLDVFTTFGQVTAYLSWTHSVTFSVLSMKAEGFQWIQANLFGYEFLPLSKSDKEFVCRYLEKGSGYSWQHLTWFIRQSHTQFLVESSVKSLCQKIILIA